MARRTRGTLLPGTSLARELGRGARVWTSGGSDITEPVRAAYRAALPTCGGDRASAAVSAVNAALAGQRREER
jgi:hypothetical protein